MGRIDYVNSQGNVKAGTTVFASPLSISLSFTFLKSFLYTQSVVRVLYLVRVLYSVRSPHFILSPYFKPSPQSVFYTNRFFVSRSEVHALSLTPTREQTVTNCLRDGINWLPLQLEVKVNICVQVHKRINVRSPGYMSDL